MVAPVRRRVLGCRPDGVLILSCGHTASWSILRTLPETRACPVCTRKAIERLSVKRDWRATPTPKVIE